MTPRERFIAALERRPLPGRVPHFELVFFLTMEAFGRVHPYHRNYEQWWQMSEAERQLHRQDMVDLHVATAERYEHDAIFLHPQPLWNLDETMRQLDILRDRVGDRYFVMIHGDATFAIPDGGGLAEFSYRMVDEPQSLRDEAARMVDRKLAEQQRLADHGGLDGLALCSDYCFNAGPFISPAAFDEFITPYLKRLIHAQRQLGFYTIKHTDGNIMPIIDRLVECGPHALHSLDPQGGVDIAEAKRLYGHRVCLCGNVDCGLMDTGTEAQVLESARYALERGSAAARADSSPGGGYIFCTSNCIYTGMRLDRYELIWNLWRDYQIPRSTST